MTATDASIEELRRAGLFDKDSDYGGMIGDAVKELLLVFQKQGHSGFSANRTASIFHALVRGEVLSPLTENKDEWMEHTPGSFQSTRCSFVFWEPATDPRPYSIEGRIFSDNGGASFFTNRESRVYFDLPGFPPKTERVILQ